jgi:hypothetical protein
MTPIMPDRYEHVKSMVGSHDIQTNIETSLAPTLAQTLAPIYTPTPTISGSSLSFAASAKPYAKSSSSYAAAAENIAYFSSSIDDSLCFNVFIYIAGAFLLW